MLKAFSNSLWKCFQHFCKLTRFFFDHLKKSIALHKAAKYV